MIKFGDRGEGIKLKSLGGIEQSTGARKSMMSTVRYALVHTFGFNVFYQKRTADGLTGYNEAEATFLSSVAKRPERESVNVAIVKALPNYAYVTDLFDPILLQATIKQVYKSNKNAFEGYSLTDLTGFLHKYLPKTVDSSVSKADEKQVADMTKTLAEVDRILLDLGKGYDDIVNKINKLESDQSNIDKDVKDTKEHMFKRMEKIRKLLNSLD